MTYETYKHVLQALANGRPCNTTNCFSVSVDEFTFKGVTRYSLDVYPSEHYPWFTSSSLVCLLAITEVFDVTLCLNTKHGSVIASFS